MKGKCNCGKKATGEYLVKKGNAAWTIKLCNNCKPHFSYNTKFMTLIDGK